MTLGDHLYVRRKGYAHHGVDVGEDEVIHFTGEPGSKAGALIQRSTLAEFAGSGRVEIRPYERALPPHEVVARAESKLGESGYNLFNNNCEHFARWCITGKHSSSQVNGAAASGGAAVVSGAAAVGGIGVVAAAGTPGLSAAGIMSGLAAIGPAGVMGGLVTVGAMPGLASAAIMQVALKDDEALPAGERTARRVGRTTSVAGATAATVGGVVAVSQAGVVAGLSAAGISSGLAAIGGTMAVGTGIVVAGPAVAAAGIGFMSYRVARRVSARRRNQEAALDADTVDQADLAGGAHAADDNKEALVAESSSVADDLLQMLTVGPCEMLADLSANTGDTAGVYTVWYRDRLVSFGRAGDTRETKPSNSKQADGVRGRVRGLTRQPGKPLQLRLEMSFASDWAASTAPNDQKRATDLLRTQGSCRIVRFDSGDASAAALATVEDRLADLLIA